MMKVFYTVDTEVWCEGWKDIDAKFPDCYRKYVYGPTPSGDFALPYQLRLLSDHGLLGVFFVEPLFAMRFGLEPLREIVGLIQAAGHEVQLHLHTEWLDEAPVPLIAGLDRKRRFIRQFSRTEQATLLAAGLDLLRQAGARPANAFRAGSFGFNRDTLRALAECGVTFDSSYAGQQDIDVHTGQLLTQPFGIDGVFEYPVTMYRHWGTRSVRPLHLTACSFAEMEWLLNAACDAKWDSVVIVSHNFELLARGQKHPDRIVIERFRKLCRFLERNSDRFSVAGFQALGQPSPRAQLPLLHSPRTLTVGRNLEQLARRAVNKFRHLVASDSN